MGMDIAVAANKLDVKGGNLVTVIRKPAVVVTFLLSSYKSIEVTKMAGDAELFCTNCLREQRMSH